MIEQLCHVEICFVQNGTASDTVECFSQRKISINDHLHASS